MTWAATQAKAKFSEVLDKAESEGPQLVRRRKREFVVLTREEFAARNDVGGGREKVFENAWEALRPSFAARYDDIEFPRMKGKARSVRLG